MHEPTLRTSPQTLYPVLDTKTFPEIVIKHLVFFFSKFCEFWSLPSLPSCLERRPGEVDSVDSQTITADSWQRMICFPCKPSTIFDVILNIQLLLPVQADTREYAGVFPWGQPALHMINKQQTSVPSVTFQGSTSLYTKFYFFLGPAFTLRVQTSITFMAGFLSRYESFVPFLVQVSLPSRSFDFFM